MIKPDKRIAIYCLHNEGVSIRKISKSLRVGRNTVKSIIAEKGAMPDTIRKDKIDIDSELLRELYRKCDSRVQRMHEILTEEEGITVGYSTLTEKVRELGLGRPRKARCDRVPDEPGAEMQHDTSPYTLKVGEKKINIVGSVLYFRYSKVRYLKFYRNFNRFNMKCFFHEALRFWKYAAPKCVIDNTNLARLRGAGGNAVMAPEMERFAEKYGFKFICHEIDHANRKAGNERSFYTVETNFFPGRKFESMEDLNRKAFTWATVRMTNRPVSKTGLIPAKAFEHEQAYLTRLPPFIEAPYLVHKRGTDQYGYASIDGNFFWIPGASRIDVTALQYSDHIKIFHRRKMLIKYDTPAAGVKNELISPKGEPKPKFQPKHRKKPTDREEKALRAASKEVNDYLNFAFKRGLKQRHRFIRQLYGLYRKLALTLFVEAIRRALKYRITEIKTIERIAVLQMRVGNYEASFVEIDHEFTDRESYREGRFSDKADLSKYDKMMEDDDG